MIQKGNITFYNIKAAVGNDLLLVVMFASLNLITVENMCVLRHPGCLRVWIEYERQ